MSSNARPTFHRRTLRRFAALGGILIIVTASIGAAVVTAADSAGHRPSQQVGQNEWSSTPPSNPANVFGSGADDGLYVTTNVANADEGYGGFAIAIPAGSIINGITVRLDAKSTDADGCDLSVRLSGNAGGSWTNYITQELGSTETPEVFGGPGNDWGLVWDPTMLANAKFRLEMRNIDDSGCTNGSTTSVDWIDVAVDYTTIDQSVVDNDPLTAAICDQADFNFIIDMSGSIGDQNGISNLADLKKGINDFVSAFETNGGDGVYSGTKFNGTTAVELTNGYVSDAAFHNIINNNLGTPTGTTPTAEGIDTGAANDTPGDRPAPDVMFVVTDGSPNVPGGSLSDPATWLVAANAAIAAADDARADYIVQAVYLSAPGDPGDTTLPFSYPDGRAQWATAVMNEIGHDGYLPADFASFANDLFEAIHCTPDIKVTKSADNSPINAGETAAFTLTVDNIGRGLAKGVTLSDQLPGGITWSEDSAQCSINGSGLLTCNFGDIASDDPPKVIHVTGATDADDCGTLPNTANVAATNEPDDVLGNNHDSASIIVQCGKVTIIKNAVPNDAQDFAFTTSGTGLSGFSLDDDGNGTLPNSKVFGQVTPGAYTITEGGVAGWKLTNLACNDPNGSVDLDARKATLNVGPNEEITCTFTNTKLGTIIVEKQTQPDGSAGTFTFTGTAAGSIGDNGQIVVTDLVPGTYTSTEADPAPPFDLGAIVCDDANSTGSVGTRTATFRLEAGETVKCTFTNVKRGNITIIKDAVPNDPQDFGFSGLGGFSLDDDDDGTLSNTFNATNITPGSYTVTEGNVSGWELTGLVCIDGDGGTTVSVADRQAVIDLDPGQSVTCTFTNTKAGRIIVDKVTDPVGDGASFEFDPSYGPNFFLTDAAAPNDSGDLKPGTYSVAELAKAGWDLTGATCTDGSPVEAISLQAGETVTCTFSNTKRGHILIDKVTLPAGDPASFEFDPSYGPNFNLTDASPVSDSGALVPGTYSVAELAKAGWDLTGATCTDGSPVEAISLQAGETVTCTFSNTKRGHILIDKVTLPAGDPASFEFDPSYGPNFNLTDASPVSDSGALVPGTYSVAELALAGWDLTGTSCTDGSPVGAIVLGAGETVTCTFSNTKRGHILIDKVTDPAGDAAVFEFDPSYGANFSLTDASDPNDSGALVPGTYSVAELAKSGWDLTATSCTDQSPVGAISLQPGETVTCTFTNTKRGTIIVEKQTSPDGAAGSFTFSGTAAGTIGDNGTITVDNLVPGSYTSTENDPGPDFDLGAIVCDDGGSPTPSSVDVAERSATFELDPGETITCVFTNVQRGTITIIKDAVPDGAQDFAFTATGSGLTPFSLDDDDTDALSNMKAFGNLLAGPYSVTETTVAGWDLTDIDCTVAGGSTAVRNGATVNLNLTSGGSITCVYVNQRPSISIVKTAGTAEDGEEFVTPPGPVTYHYLVTNSGPVTLSGIVVSDDNGTPGDTSDDFEADCPETSLDAGESMECTATVGVTGNRTNIGTATGASEGGTQVSDTDDAVVRVPGIDIAKSADDHFVEPNQAVTFTINVTVVNGPVQDATVTDTLPAGQTYVPGTSTVDGAPSEPDVAGQVLTWHLGTLDDEDSPVVIVYDVVINGDASTDPQTNVAELCVSELPECDRDEETVTPQQPGIEIVKTAGSAPDGTVYETEPGNVTYTYVVENTGPLPLEDVTVTDDNGTPEDPADDFAADCPETTLAAAGEAGDSMTCTATVAVTVDTTNVALAHGVTAEGNPVEDDDDAIVEVYVHGLAIDKSNDAPIVTLELPDGTTAEVPTASEGSTVTFSLDYTFTGDPVTNGRIVDVLPAGLTYVAGSATSTDEFTFVEYDPDARTLTWTAQVVTESGTLSYQATVDKGASALVQPLENIATISSDQTEPDDDRSDVFVPVIPKAETETAPPTDVLADPDGPGAPGSSLLLVLAVLGGLVLAIGFVTPVPATVRRRYRG